MSRAINTRPQKSFAVNAEKYRDVPCDLSIGLPISYIGPKIDAEILAIVYREVGKFKGVHLPRPGAAVAKQLDFRIDDLVSAGHLAVVNARDSYDPTRGASFPTWVTTLVRQAIRKPRRRDPLAGDFEVASLEAPIDDEDEFRLDGIRAPKKAHAPGGLSWHVWRRLQDLMPPKDFDVLIFRYVGYTRDEIGNRLGVSAERVRQIEVAAGTTAAALIRNDSVARRAFLASWLCADAIAAVREAQRSYRRANQAKLWKWRDEQKFQREWEAAGRYPVKVRLYSAAAIAMLAAKELGVSCDPAV